jgi:hypothetical protein
MSGVAGARSLGHDVAMGGRSFRVGALSALVAIVLIAWYLSLAIHGVTYALTPNLRDRTMAWIMAAIAGMAVLGCLVTTRGAIRALRGNPRGLMSAAVGTQFTNGLALFSVFPVTVIVGPIGCVIAVVVLVGQWVIVPKIARAIGSVVPPSA